MELKLSMKIQSIKEKIINENPRILLGIAFPWFHVDDHQNLLIMISVVKTHIGMFGQHRWRLLMADVDVGQGHGSGYNIGHRDEIIFLLLLC